MQYVIGVSLRRVRGELACKVSLLILAESKADHPKTVIRWQEGEPILERSGKIASIGFLTKIKKPYCSLGSDYCGLGELTACVACGQLRRIVHQAMHQLSPDFPKGKVPVVERPFFRGLNNA